MIRKNSTTPTSNERMAVYSSTACNCCSFILLVFSFIAPCKLSHLYDSVSLVMLWVHFGSYHVKPTHNCLSCIFVVNDDMEMNT